MSKRMQDYERALLDPMTVYARPAQVLDDDALDLGQKLNILRRWELDSRELQVAEEEGMTNGEPDLLTEVLQAIGTLDPDAEHHRLHAPTKQGGSHGVPD
ncbi:MAG: hypothetical protein WCZ87_08100 [Thiohalobacteraceae bacterium]